MEPPVYNPLVRSAGDNLDLWLESEMGGGGSLVVGSPQHMEADAIFVGSVRIQLNCRTPR